MKKIPKFAIIAAIMVALAAIMFAVALLAGGRNDSAPESSYQQMEDTQPEDDQVVQLTAQVQQLQKELEQYGVDMKQTMEREEAAINAYNEMQTRLDTAESEAETYRVAAESAMEERTKALEEKDRVVLLYEKLWRAMTYFDQGRYDECKAVLDEMEYLQPEEYLSSTSDSALILTPAAKYQQMVEYFN